MASEPLLDGITSSNVKTPRLTMRVLEAGLPGAVPVVLLHGNVSAARYWEETMLALADNYRVLAPDLRGYGETEALTLDATRGLRDWSDDLKSMVETLGLGQFHLVGWSMGGGVGMQYAIDHASDLLSLTLMNPLSPFGFGGTRDAEGNPTYDDFAGSGGGTVNPEFIRLLVAGDRTADSPFTALSTQNAFYFKPPFRPTPEREEVFISEMLSTRTGDGFYPGDMVTSPNWPGVGPGTKGINNTMSPKYCDLSSFASIDPQVPVLWVRGAEDQIVSDTSLFDFGFLGQIGAVPGWPEADIYPPQPMVSQMRTVLERYRAGGGFYREEVIEDCGHSPHIEKADQFQALLREQFAM